MKTLLASLIVCACMAGVVVAGDDRPTKGVLPDDGTWVRYNVTMKRTDIDLKGTYTLTMGLVGTVKEGDKVLRWVEMRFDEKDSTSIEKYLIPQSAILEGDNPAAETVRGWSRTGKDAIAIDNKHSPAYTEELAFLPGPLRKARELKEKKTIEFEKRRIEAPSGLTGEATAAYPRADGKATRKITYLVWVHPEVPFGVVAARTSMQCKVNDKQIGSCEREYTLIAQGKSAGSSLTEK